MIKEFSIENFKCFRKEIIEFANLNVFTGRNSSGKTSIIQALLLMYQAQEQQKGNVLNGRYVKLGQYSDIQSIYSRDNVNLKLKIDDKLYEASIDENGCESHKIE